MMTDRELFKQYIAAITVNTRLNEQLSKARRERFAAPDSETMVERVLPATLFLDRLLEGERTDWPLHFAMRFWRATLRDRRRQDQLLGLGIPYFGLAFRHLIGCGRRPGNDALCVTFGVTAGRPFSLYDLLFIPIDDPARWTRWRDAETVLCTDPSAFHLSGWPENKRIRLYAQPIDWLREGAQDWSYCVLDWESWDAKQLLDHIDTGKLRVVCDSDDHERAISKLVRPRRKAMALEVAV